MGNEEPMIPTPERPSDNDPVSVMLGGLNRVEAPGDFDFKVRAGIAARRSAGGRTSWLPVRAVWAAPVSLSLLVGGYFAFNTFYFPGDEGLQAAAEVRPAELSVPIVPSTTPVVETPSSAPTIPTSEAVGVETSSPLPFNAVVRTTPRPVSRRTSSSTERPDRSGGGSFDEASREGRILYPRGLDPNGTITTDTAPTGDDGRISVRAVLSFIGIDASYSVSGWSVRSVAPNNLGARSGVKAGDIIEAINDQTLTGNTDFGKSFNGRSLRVRRDGKTMTIPLRP